MISPPRVSAPAAEFAQEEVCVASRVGNVSEDGRAAGLARVVNDEVAEAQEALRDGRGDGHVLNVSQRDVARRTRDEALVNLYLRVGERVAHRVALQVLVGRDEQQRERERERDEEGDANPRLPREQSDEEQAAERRQQVTYLDEEQSRADCEDDLLVAFALVRATFRHGRERADGERLDRAWARLRDARLFGCETRRLGRDARLFRVGGRAACGAEARRRRQTLAAVVACVHFFPHSVSPKPRNASSN